MTSYFLLTGEYYAHGQDYEVEYEYLPRTKLLPAASSSYAGFVLAVCCSAAAIAEH